MSNTAHKQAQFPVPPPIQPRHYAPPGFIPRAPRRFKVWIYRTVEIWVINVFCNRGFCEVFYKYDYLFWIDIKHKPNYYVKHEKKLIVFDSILYDNNSLCSKQTS